ncbi:MAG: hypothetical protein K2X87_17360 [Gemmataceae bacterium]|nr:hypothetical protein [Gemmataceae bacterium]
MRPLTILSVVAVLGAGCTHTALERRTVKQASTLTDLQHQQVLDNLAAIACNPEALPWHTKVKGGLVQITDQGTATFGAEFGLLVDGGIGSKFIPGVSGQRGVVGQWELDPTTEAEELELLRLAYRKATDPGNPEVSAEIYKTIGQLSVRFDILPKQEVRRQIFLMNDVLTIIKRRQDELDKLIPQLAGEVGTLPTEESKSGADVANRQRQNDLVAVLRRNVQEKYELEQMTKLVDEDLKATATTGSPRLGITGTQVLESSRPVRNTVTDDTGGQKQQQVVNQPAGQKTLRLAAIEMALGAYTPSRELPRPASGTSG